MIAGIGFVGVVAANLATRLFARIGEEIPEIMRSDQEVTLERIEQRITDLNAQISNLQGNMQR
jgi:hypothetical protein